MSVQRVAHRYAKSLVGMAEERGKLDAVRKDLQGFMKVMENRDFANLVKSPIVKGGKKKAVFDAIFDGKVDEITSAFFGIVLRKGREALLPAIAKEYDVEYKKIKHISDVRLVTARPLSEASLQAIKQRISSLDSMEEHLEMDVRVDENLIGGFIIEFDDKRFDASVANKLAEVKKEFRENSYVREL